MTSKTNPLLNFEFKWEALDTCPICDGTIMIPNGKIKWLDWDFWYVVCPVCNLKFMNPRPTQASYLEYYKDYFWQQKVRNLGFKMMGQMWNTARYAWYDDKKWDAKKGVKMRLKRHLELRFDVITETLKKHIALNKKTELLEIGAGFGVVLNEINKRHGSTVHAIEPSKEARKSIEKFGTIELVGDYAEDLEKLCKKKKKYDALIFSHALENTVYPLQIMKWAKTCLKSEGVIYVQCSNLFTFDQMNPYHPYIFSEQAFRMMAKKLGMKQERHGEHTHRMLTVVFEK